MRYREMQQAARTLLTLLEVAAPALRQPEEATAAGQRMINNNINYVNQTANVETTLPGSVQLSGEAVSPEAQTGVAQRQVSDDPLTLSRQPTAMDEGPESAAAGLPAGVTAEGLAPADPEGALEDIDRFFRRDSRRYDSGFAPL